MSDIRKVPATAGAHWLLNGFSLFRRAPLRLAQLGVLLAMSGLVGMLLSQLGSVLGTLAQMAVIFGAPVLMGGLIWAVREAEHGQQPLPRHLLEGFRAGRLRHLLVAVLPYFLASIALGSLLLVMVGNDGLQRWQEVQLQVNAITQAGGQLSPEQLYEMAESLPVFRFLLWVVITLCVNLAVMLMLAVMLPQVMFTGTGGWAALINSLRTCARNFPAMALFYLLSALLLFALNLAAAMVMLVFGALMLPGVGVVLALGLSAAVILPVFAGAIYSAWQQMFGQATVAAPAPPRQDLFEA